VEKLRIPAYVRYMDDMLLWADDGGELLEKGAMFEKFIGENLGLSLKPILGRHIQAFRVEPRGTWFAGFGFSGVSEWNPVLNRRLYPTP